MGRIEDRIAELGIELPAPFAPPPGIEFSFELVTITGGLAYISGHGPADGTELLVAGKVGADVSLEEAVARRAPDRALDLRLAQAGARRARPRQRAGSRRSASSTAPPAST